MQSIRLLTIGPVLALPIATLTDREVTKPPAMDGLSQPKGMSLMLITLREFIASIKQHLDTQDTANANVENAIELMVRNTEDLDVKRSIGFFACQLAFLVELETAIPLESALDEAMGSLNTMKNAVDYALEQLKNG